MHDFFKIISAVLQNDKDRSHINILDWMQEWICLPSLNIINVAAVNFLPDKS